MFAEYTRRRKGLQSQRAIVFRAGSGRSARGPAVQDDLTLPTKGSFVVIRRPTENRPGTRDETVEGTPSSRAMVIKPILAEEISENPRCSGNREGLGGFAPIRMIVGIRENQRYPHE